MTYPEAGTITAGGHKVSCDVATEGSVMEIAGMQKMIMIPEERYDRMIKSYDEVKEELMDIREQLNCQNSGKRLEIGQVLNHMGEEKVELVHRFCLGLSRGGR